MNSNLYKYAKCIQKFAYVYIYDVCIIQTFPIPRVNVPENNKKIKHQIYSHSERDASETRRRSDEQR